ncbi:fumarylacetoacetate hydrolase family protein [Calidifontimicrobium sp. SYSU G02091]|uniref:fumarylacetoacetate hydrolase family protein n=1 Tax=Calidifontimicrobium sp. SYSU G02091 TaxID=2926421 RepID=UPI001F52DBD6|nr:fumarylacetoacetate hydrolase family protein [Calidifontimicrobium sp. SYSU G02091]
MRLCRFDGDRLGVVEGDEVLDVSAALDALPVVRYPLPAHDLLVEALPRLRPRIESLCPTAPRRPLAAVRLEPPVANPGKIIGAPINYHAHATESAADSGIAHGRQITSIGEWGLFLKARSALIGPGEPIRLRFPQRRNDHEVELGVVIGRTARHVTRDEALDHVAGYLVALDITLRGPEFVCFRKSIDTYAVTGPWLVTADEIPDPGRLDLWLAVNGERRQRSNTRHLIYDVPRLIEFASSFYTLQPGDILMTGTPEGVGPLQPGDRIEAGVQGVGVLAVRVAGDDDAPTAAPA